MPNWRRRWRIGKIPVAAGRAPKIVVLDFCTWDNQWRPFGAWLADNLSAAWAAGNDGGFAMIDRAKLAAVLQARGLTAKDEFESPQAIELAQALGADILVNGRYRALENDLGLTVNVRPAVAPAASRGGTTTSSGARFFSCNRD